MCGLSPKPQCVDIMIGGLTKCILLSQQDSALWNLRYRALGSPSSRFVVSHCGVIERYNTWSLRVVWVRELNKTVIVGPVKVNVKSGSTCGFACG
jgi:hypothetical protein